MLTQFLKSEGFEGLAKLSIGTNRHSTLPLTILNYNQIDSPKFHPIVRQCRGTVIDDDFNVVAKAFDRFYNLGENPNEECDVKQADLQEKVDGSLILLYYWNGWRVNTRNSWADGEINGVVWSDLVWRNLNKNFLEGLPRNITYVLELVSPYNQVVRAYKEGLYLLAAFAPQYDVDGYVEVKDLKEIAGWLGVKLPNSYQFGLEEARDYLEKCASTDPTFEGFIFKDKQNRRVKLKSSTYLAIHRLANNGFVATKRGFSEFYAKGEEAELMVVFPQYAEIFTLYKNCLDDMVSLAQASLAEYNHLEQKDFALSIKDLPYKALLFQARRSHQSIRSVLTDRFCKDWLDVHCKG